MQWFWVILLSMLPILELRGAIPLAIGTYKFNPYIGVPLIILANFLPVPIILKLLNPGERFLRQWKFWDNLMTKVFEHTRKKTKKSIEKWETLALIVFVAIPLPVTGAWTGSLAAYLFGLDIKKSMFYIFLGLCIAAAIVTAATIMGLELLV